MKKIPLFSAHACQAGRVVSIDRVSFIGCGFEQGRGEYILNIGQHLPLSPRASNCLPTLTVPTAFRRRTELLPSPAVLFSFASIALTAHLAVLYRGLVLFLRAQLVVA